MPPSETTTKAQENAAAPIGLENVMPQCEMDPATSEDLGGESSRDFRTSTIRSHLGLPFAPGKKVRVEPVDFRTPKLLAEMELRRLRMSHDLFARNLGKRFTAFFRAGHVVEVSNLQTMPFGQWTESVGSPTHLTVFRAETLGGMGVLEIPLSLALTMANRMLGGRGHGCETPRMLTEIEVALLEDAIALILEEWCAQWRDQPEVRASLIGHESNARFLQCCQRGTSMLVLSIDIRADEAVEVLQMAVPLEMVEPILKQHRSAASHCDTREKAETASCWRSNYDGISVPVVADWHVSDVSLFDLLHMREGDILELSSAILRETRVHVGSVPRFIGAAGSENGRVAVQILKEIPAP